MVSAHGRRGWRSPPQVTALSMTTHFGMTNAEVAAIHDEIAARRADAIAVTGVVPDDLAVERAGVGVDEQLVGIEAVAVGRVVGAVDAVAVELAGTHVGQIAVPDLVGVFGQRDARRSRAAPWGRRGRPRPWWHWPRTGRNSPPPRPRLRRADAASRARPAASTCWRIAFPRLLPSRVFEDRRWPVAAG